MAVLLFFSVLIFLFLLHQFWYRRRNLPPGPVPLPLFGNILSLLPVERWEDKLGEWAKQYGPIYTIWLGSQEFVTVNDYETAMNMFVKDGDTYSDRAVDPAFDFATRRGRYGIISTSGQIWRDQRKFGMRVLRDFGLGQNKMQDRIIDELQTMLDGVNNDISAGIEEHDLFKYTDIAIGSVINAVICGYRFTANGKQEEFYRLKIRTLELMKSFGNPLLMLSLKSDLMKKVPYVKDPFFNCVRLFGEIFEFLDKIADEHLKNNDYSESFEPQDVMDAFFLEAAKENADKEQFSRGQLRNTCFDLWFGGQETTSSTLTWVIGYLINYPEIQLKIHEELDQAIGENRIVTVADRTNLPFLNASIAEAQRCANITPINMPRKAGRDVVIGGVKIPAGATVIPQISVMMSDPKVFPDAKKFNPLRFIDEKGQFKNIEQVMPFSLGKRACMGEGMARMELFLFTANIFHQYKITAGKVPPVLKKEGGGSGANMKLYKCRVEKRF